MCWAKEILLGVNLAIAALPIFAEIKLGAPFTDGAVLQRVMKVPVWGTVTSPASKTARSVKFEFA